MKKLILLISFFSFLLSNDNIIVDKANIINWDDKTKEMYKQYNNALLNKYDIDFRTMTTTSDKDINIYSNNIFNSLSNITRSKSGRTLLFVINSKQDKVRLEVSKALEPIYTDAFTSYIERKGIVPYLKDNKISDGVYAMVELITDKASESKGSFMNSMKSESIGGGSKTKAHINNGGSSKKGDFIDNSGNTPNDVFDIYLNKVLKKGNKNPNLDIYTDKTKIFFKSWTVTDINQKHEIHSISKCVEGKKLFKSPNNKYAVLMNHPVKQRTCSPYLLKIEDGKWKLDIFTMSKTIRFNQPMQWHFNLKERKQYASNYDFIFNTFNYDKNGYPFIAKKKGRWGFTCRKYYNPKDKDKFHKCYIINLRNDGVALNDLGLKVHDKVISIGKGKSYIKNISFDGFMDYMITAKKGEKVYVKVLRKGELVNLKGKAPKK